MSDAMTVQVTGPVVDVLMEVVHHGSTVSFREFPPVSTGACVGLELGGRACRLVVEEERLKLYIATSEANYGDLFAAMDVRNQPALLRLEDGTTVTAKVAQLKSISDEAEVHLFHWHIASAEEPQFWVGKIEADLPSCDNMAIMERGPGSTLKVRNGFRLLGQHVWNLLPGQSGGHLAVIETGGRPFDRDAMVSDLLALQFALGRPVRLHPLVGLAAGRRRTAGVALDHFMRAPDRHRCPVPDGLWSQAYMPELFRLIAAKMASDGRELLTIPITAYLDSVVDHLDGAYLKAQVGLEAFATRLAKRSTRRLLVRDERSWKRWIKSLREQMKEHLLDEAKLGTVSGKFIAAMFAPTGDVVAEALGQHGVQLPPDVLEEIRKRSYPAHGFLMNSEAKYEFDRDVRRLRMIQTVLAALVAAHVGYKGAIQGYDLPAGLAESPSWWPAILEEGCVRYRAERVVTAE